MTTFFDSLIGLKIIKNRSGRVVSYPAWWYGHKTDHRWNGRFDIDIVNGKWFGGDANHGHIANSIYLEIQLHCFIH